MTRPLTAEQRRHANIQALALLTAASGEDIGDHVLERLIVDQGDAAPLVLASMTGMASELLETVDRMAPGFAAQWLAGMGRHLNREGC